MNELTINRDDSAELYLTVAQRTISGEASTNKEVQQEYGLLPPGVKSLRRMYGRNSTSQYLSILYETRPQRREILFRPKWKGELERDDREPSDSDYYSLPFPWMQFHITIPIFDAMNTHNTMNMSCSLTNKQFESMDQPALPIHLPNTIYPSNAVCIYGDALGITKREYNILSAEDLEAYDIGSLISTIVGSIFYSGWNMNVSDWPQVIPEEFGVEEREYESEEFFYEDYGSLYDPMETILRWENMSIEDMLNLKAANETIADLLYRGRFDGPSLVDKPTADSLVKSLSQRIAI